jgi:AraC-like DNA-binding protein
MPEPSLSPGLARHWWHCGVRVHHAGRQQHAGAYQQRRAARDQWTLYVQFYGHLRLLFAEQEVEMSGAVAYLVPPQTALRECGTADPIDQFVAGFHILSETGWSDPLLGLEHPHAVPVVDPPTWSAWCDEVASCFDQFRQIDMDHCVRARPALDRLLTAYLTGLGTQTRRRPPLGEPAWLQALRERMVHALLDPGLDHADLLRWSGVSAAHLHRCFHRWHGMSPLRFLRRERLALAARLLRVRPDESIGAIVHSCGYRDAALFSRHFRAQFGTSPRAWRSRRDAGD